jgi:hypothetical protein
MPWQPLTALLSIEEAPILEYASVPRPADRAGIECCSAVQPEENIPSEQTLQHRERKPKMVSKRRIHLLLT